VIELEKILHPIILKHAYPQFIDGHFRDAVLDGIIAVFDLIRVRTGLDLDGTDLVGRAFSLTDPVLILSELDTESGKNDQKGFIQILQGVYVSIRNPKAHSLITDLDLESAAQYLVFESLLARRVEEAKFGNILRFNGLYVAVNIRDNDTYCLRFYKDGMVLSITIGGTNIDVLKIMTELTKENVLERDYSKGKYNRNGNKINFSTSSKYGTSDYEGEISEKILNLNIHGHTSSFRSFRKYTFIEVQSSPSREGVV
jgi:uncharacterized protein (TIGR02391 family)